MSMKRVAGITALITAMAFVNNISDLTIVGKNNICYAKVVRKVTRNIVIQKKTQLDQATQDAQDTPTGRVVDIVYEPSKVEEKYDTPETEKVELKETEENTKLKDKNDLNLITVPNKNTEFRLGDTTTYIDQYIKVNSSSGFKVVNDISTYSKYSEYLNNGQRTYIFTTKNFNSPIAEPLTINGNLIIEAAMYIALQSNNYELTVNGNLIITDNGSIRCCMEKANDTGFNTIRVEGNIVFDGQTHKMSLTEQSYGFSMPLNYARSTQSLRFSSSGTWYAVNGKIDDYYNVKDVANKQTKYITGVKKPDVSSVFDKKGNGDVNGDGMVNDADVDLLKKYLINVVGDKDINKSNADVNGDGKVTLTDLSQLKTKIDENKVKSPLIELTDKEINTKYAQYKKYLKLPRTYYAQDNDLSSLIKNNKIEIMGNLILDKHLGDRRLNSEKRIDNQTCTYTVSGSLIFIDKASGFNGDIIGTLYYNPSKWNASDYDDERGKFKKYLIDAVAYGDVYIMANPYSKLYDSVKYGREEISIAQIKNANNINKIYYSDNSYMNISNIYNISKKEFLSDIRTHNMYIDTPMFIRDNIIVDNYYLSSKYYSDSDNDFITISYAKKFIDLYTRVDGVRADLIESKYKGRIKALIALLLQDKRSDIENLPFLKIVRTTNYRSVAVLGENSKPHYYIEIRPDGLNKWSGIFFIQDVKCEIKVLLSEEYEIFKNKFEKILQNPSILQDANSGYSALIRSIFESGIDYWLEPYGSWDSFKCKREINYNLSQERYYTYPITKCLQTFKPYINHVKKGEKPYSYDFHKADPNPTPEQNPGKINNSYGDWLDEILQWSILDKDAKKAAEIIFWNKIVNNYFALLFADDAFSLKSEIKNINRLLNKFDEDTNYYLEKEYKDKYFFDGRENEIQYKIRKNNNINTTSYCITIVTINKKIIEKKFTVVFYEKQTNAMINEFKTNLYMSGAKKMESTLKDIFTNPIKDVAIKAIPNNIYKVGVKALKLIFKPF